MMLQRYIPCNHYCIDHLIYRYTDNGPTGLLGATALSIAPWIITGVTIYGVIDIGVTLGTGTSLSGWIGEWTE